MSEPTEDAERTALAALIADEQSYMFDEADSHEGWSEVDRIKGDHRRWSSLDTVILKSPTGRFWKITKENSSLINEIHNLKTKK